MYVTSHKRPFVPSFGITIGLLCNVQAQSLVSFVKHQQTPAGYLLPLGGSVTFCEKFVVVAREYCGGGWPMGGIP